MAGISITEADQRRNQAQILDVREDFEVAEGMIPGAIHIPMGELQARLAELDAAGSGHRHLPQRQPQRPCGGCPQRCRLHRRHHGRRHDRVDPRGPADHLIRP